MKKMFDKQHRFRTIAGLIIAGSVITAALLILIPVDYRPESTTEEIIEEMVSRTEAVSEQRDQLNFVSVTPFLWDEGYFIDHTMDETALKELGRNITYQPLDDEEQRLVFYYNGQLTADLIIPEDEIHFDIAPGAIDISDGWLNIDTGEGIRLYR